MHPGQRKAEHAVMRWAEKNPDATKIPAHIETYLNVIQRYNELDFNQSIVRIDQYEREEIKNDLLASMPEYSKRREAEQDLAIYIDEVAGSQFEPDLYDVAQKLNDCRQSGAVGIKPDGGNVIAWDQKCGIARLCPDESREETQRLSEWYLPAMLDFEKEHATHRIFYAVFTDHNFRPGQLRTGKKYLFDKFKEWRENQGESLKGSLVIQEDPLSAAGDWNIHLNVFLLVKGRFDYQDARAAWGCNVQFREIEGTPEAIRGALLEAIKYSAMIVPDKSAEHAADGTSAAPAMIQWPHDLWLEWWKAGKGFRRVRSYGCLYGLHEKRWHKARARDQVDWCVMADLDTVGIVGEAWRSLDEPTRAKLRKVITHGEPLDMTLIQWIGVLNFNEGRGYSVDLIPEDNFSRALQSGHNSRPYSDRGGGGYG